ncbi:AraC family transcriptional regulator [Ruegeria sp. 2205SS24-7]|uniref:helix-turn-helix domain-containing protein n=1 Tax=Ruegeria discodermiae TaxID=3064389 RepID=UPI0027408DEE|nr:AraC family transcriptional regulator [Ruegeria sp. 2205SS24-7]MDP5219897.1 AraC family transcriptional regulator [Ruegeria sp. 2205SS24-7]
MDTPSLVSLPLPMATALLCATLAGLVFKLNLGSKYANAFFAGFFGLGALSSCLVALRFGYGFQNLIPLQRTVPLFVAPTLYLGFASLTIGQSRALRLALLHLSAAVAVIMFFVRTPFDLRFLDLVISASYAFYCVALFLLWRRGPDALIQAPVSVSGTLSNWVLRSAGFLLFVLALDSAIALDFALTRGANTSLLISYGTVPLLMLLLATLITLPKMLSKPQAVPDRTLESAKEDQELLNRLDRLMVEQRLYLEPDITVQRLARRLTVPTRNLSAVVNRTQGLNMSQYVNRFRLQHAAHLLSDTEESVTSIATQSGFMARSNFYREFQRVFGQTPVEFRASVKQSSNIKV